MSTSQEEGGTLNWSCWCLGRALREQGKSKREKTPLRETEDEDLTGGDDQRGLERGRGREPRGRLDEDRIEGDDQRGLERGRGREPRGRQDEDLIEGDDQRGLERDLTGSGEDWTAGTEGAS